jgi:hypothetical protein
MDSSTLRKGLRSLGRRSFSSDTQTPPSSWGLAPEERFRLSAQNVTTCAPTVPKRNGPSHAQNASDFLPSVPDTPSQASTPVSHCKHTTPICLTRPFRASRSRPVLHWKACRERPSSDSSLRLRTRLCRSLFHHFKGESIHPVLRQGRLAANRFSQNAPTPIPTSRP